MISDELNHASIIDGIRLCKAARYRCAALRTQGLGWGLGGWVVGWVGAWAQCRVALLSSLFVYVHPTRCAPMLARPYLRYKHMDMGDLTKCLQEATDAGSRIKVVGAGPRLIGPGLEKLQHSLLQTSKIAEPLSLTLTCCVWKWAHPPPAAGCHRWCVQHGWRRGAAARNRGGRRQVGCLA